MAKNGILATTADLKPSFEGTSGRITIGIDLGDRFSHCCVLDTDGEVLTEGRVRSTPEAMARHFQELPSCRIAIEVGAHSRWLSRSETRKDIGSRFPPSVVVMSSETGKVGHPPALKALLHPNPLNIPTQAKNVA